MDIGYVLKTLGEIAYGLFAVACLAASVISFRILKDILVPSHRDVCRGLVELPYHD